MVLILMSREIQGWADVGYLRPVRRPDPGSRNRAGRSIAARSAFAGLGPVELQGAV